MIELSTDELDFFKNIFSEPPEEGELLHPAQQLSVHTTIPSNLKKLLGESKLTLLAEIGHYQLWFPVTITLDNGNFNPALGTPEIIDVQGNERSWRVNAPENLSLLNIASQHKLEILSLSGTGVTLKLLDDELSVKDDPLLKQQSLVLMLPNQQSVTLSLDVVRKDNNIIAAKFKDFDQGRESLRQFLFNSHKAKYADLYQDVIL
ncbi:hypothetical protein GCM10009111_30770 [Colwellia asteriadis]|uniref:PilZ domain-containing protein n=1 Tax=Colwellia asteriadis TaxID=517723 RepID=A0ABN1LBD3_9GAMM